MCAVPVSPRDWSWDNRCSLMAGTDSACAGVGKRCFLPAISGILAGQEGAAGLGGSATHLWVVPTRALAAGPAFLPGSSRGSCV